MAYQSNIPQPTDRLQDSQADLLGNFQAIAALITVNHATFGDPNEGKHNVVTFPVQGSTPSFLTGEEGLYNKVFNTVSELYVHKQSAAGAQEIPFTASTLSTTTPVSGSGGWTYLPSGMYLTFGSGNGTGLTTVTLTNPAPTQLLTVIVSPFSNATTYVNTQVRLVSIDSRSQFKVFCALNGAAGLSGFSFLAIGY